MGNQGVSLASSSSVSFSSSDVSAACQISLDTRDSITGVHVYQLHCTSCDLVQNITCTIWPVQEFGNLHRF